MNNGQKLCAVVKADAYGLGSKTVCDFLNSMVDYFAVSSAEEFFEINKIVSKPILILDPIYNEGNLKRLISAGAEFSISNNESFDKLKEIVIETEQTAKVHIALNTGMNRFGFKDEKSIKSILSKIKKSQKICILGVFSHYFEAKTEKYANFQYDKFLSFKSIFDNICDEKIIFHLASSDGLMFKNGFDMVRTGMIMFNDKSYQTITLKSKIIEIQNLNVGETAGYSACFVAKRKTKLAVVSIGYADGVFRNISGKGFVLVNGSYAKIVAVCMDSILIDITNIDAKIFDDVVLIGKSGNNHIYICDVAKWCDTIGYDVLVKISKRVERQYFFEGKNYANHNRKISCKEANRCWCFNHKTDSCESKRINF